jgi:inner membrane protein
MASPLTHAIVGATLSAIHGVSPRTSACWWVAIGCAVAPDLDAFGFWLGVPYGSFWGHRGFTHSIVFAILMSWTCAWWMGRSSTVSHVRLWSLYFMATLSHGVLDALTDGGLGVAFFSPLEQSRYFFPVRPIHVSSMSLRELLGPHGLHVLVNEIRWVWIPCGLTAALWWWGNRTGSVSSSG